jgi:hypothetical protein
VSAAATHVKRSELGAVAVCRGKRSGAGAKAIPPEMMALASGYPSEYRPRQAVLAPRCDEASSIEIRRMDAPESDGRCLRRGRFVTLTSRTQRLDVPGIGHRATDALRAFETAGSPAGSVSRAVSWLSATAPLSAGTAAARARFTPALGSDAPARVVGRLAQVAAQV